MKKATENFYKTVIVLLTVLAVAVFTGKAAQRTTEMLGEERTGVIDFTSIKDFAHRAVDIFVVALR